MIVDYDYGDLCRLLGFCISGEQLLEALAMFGTPPEGPGKAEVFPNRPDMLSVEGIARSLKGFLGIETGLKAYPTFDSGVFVNVDSDAVREVRPFCSFAIVDGVSLDDFSLTSIMQLQEKLHTTHGRRRRKASIGVYDLSAVKPPLKYTAMPPGDIKFVPLDSRESMDAEEMLSRHPRGREYSHLLEGRQKYPVLMDSAGTILSMPPIVNSEDTKLTAATKSVFIDATGTEPIAVGQAVMIMATSIAERFPKARIGLAGLLSRRMELDIDYCDKILGKKLTAGEIAECLGRMRLDATRSAEGKITAGIPAYRCDIMHQIDLVEDVAIAHGYGSFTPALPAMPNAGRELPGSEFLEGTRMAMVGLGFTEVLTFALSNRDRLFRRMLAPPGMAAEIANPKTADFTLVRDSLLPGLMEALGYNSHQPYPQRLFELGTLVRLDPEGREAANSAALACVAAHKDAGYSEIKSVFEAIYRNADNGMSKSELPWFIKGRQASVSGKGFSGCFGEIHPQVLENWGIGMPVAAFELAFSGIC